MTLPAAVPSVDPVAGQIGPAEIEHDPGKEIAERALQREAEDDRQHTRGGKQSLDRKLQDIGGDRKQRGEIGHAGEKILQQPALARAALEGHEGAQETDDEPGRPQPPDDLQEAMDEIEERIPRRRLRLVRNDARPREADRDQNQEYDAHDRPRQRIAAGEQLRYDDPDQSERGNDHERVVARRPCQFREARHYAVP